MKEASETEILRSAISEVLKTPARPLSKYDLGQLYLKVAICLTIQRFHPFLEEAGMPLSLEEMGLLGHELRPWIEDWYCDRIRAKSFDQAMIRHAQSAERLIGKVLGRPKKARLLKWIEFCWPTAPAYAGDENWDSSLYHLVYYTKTLVKLPSQLYRGRPLREKVEQFYVEFDEAKERFERRLLRGIKAAGPLSEWEKFLSDRCYFADEMKKPSQIILAYEHLAFCRFWKKLTEALSPAEFSILRDWAGRESDKFYGQTGFQTEYFDRVDCECLKLIG